MTRLPGSDDEWSEFLGVDDLKTQEQIAADLLKHTLAAEATLRGNTTAFVHVNRQQIINRIKQDLDFLAGNANPTTFQYLFPPILKAAWQLLTESTDQGRVFIQIALGLPRGFGKTTLIKLFILYCILFTKKRFILVINASAALAENSIADVFDMLAEKNIKSIFGDWKMGKEIDTHSLKKFSYLGRDIVVAAIGVGGSLRGMNIKHERPDVMVFDDIQTKEDSESKVTSDAIERWMFATAMKARSPNGCLHIFAGNMYPGPNSILKKLKKNKTWTKFIQGGILADGTSLWEDLKPVELLIEELNSDIEAGHPEIFFSEVLNDTEAAVNSKIDLSRIGTWEYGEHEKPQGKFIIIDPATGKSGGDKAAIGYFEVYDTVPGLRELVVDNLSPGMQIMRAFQLALKHGVKLIASESVGYQSTLLYWFQQKAQEYNIQNITFVEITTKSKSKAFRIGEMMKSLQEQEILVHPSVRSLVTAQIANYNPLKRDNVDDILDLLAYSIPVLHQYEYAISTDDSLEAIELSEGGYGEAISENTSSF